MDVAGQLSCGCQSGGHDVGCYCGWGVSILFRLAGKTLLGSSLFGRLLPSDCRRGREKGAAGSEGRSRIRADAVVWRSHFAVQSGRKQSILPDALYRCRLYVSLPILRMQSMCADIQPAFS